MESSSGISKLCSFRHQGKLIFVSIREASENHFVYISFANSGIFLISRQDSAVSGFDDHGGELELHRLDLKDSKNPNSLLVGKTRAK